MAQPIPDLLSQLRAQQAAQRAAQPKPAEMVDMFKQGSQLGKRARALWDKNNPSDPKAVPDGTPDPRPERPTSEPLPDIQPAEGIAAAPAAPPSVPELAPAVPDLAPAVETSGLMGGEGLGMMSSIAEFLADGGIADAAPRITGPGSRGGRSYLNRPHARGPKQFTRGLVRSATPGRADHVRTTVRRGSYVVPADVVSGLGQGNTDAGSALLQHATAGHGVGDAEEYADGGIADTGDVAMPVMLSGGEYVFSPKEVEAIGGGQHQAGAAALDNLVTQVRSSTKQTLAALPPPK
jgi:hypothetical protein